MSQTRLQDEILAAQIAITGKRLCSTCRRDRDASAGRMVPTANGSKRWRCDPCRENVARGTLR